MPPLNDRLRAAFVATHYWIHDDGVEWLLQVNHYSPQLARLLAERGTSNAALLTAWNPHAMQRTDALNSAAQQHLQAELAAAGHDWLMARNEDPDGRWPTEPSVLVPGLRLDAAQTLAARYGQLAFLWMQATDATPRLVASAGPRKD